MRSLHLGISKKKRKSMIFFAKYLLALWQRFAVFFLPNSLWGQQQFPHGHGALAKMHIQLPCRAMLSSPDLCFGIKLLPAI